MGSVWAVGRTLGTPGAVGNNFMGARREAIGQSVAPGVVPCKTGTRRCYNCTAQIN